MALRVIEVLGFTLALDKTPPPSERQDVLGVTLVLSFHEGRPCLRAYVDPRKVVVWLQQIHQALASDFIPHQDCEQLVGRLGFAAWAVWGPVSWTHLRRLQLHSLRGAGILSSGARSDLEWWAHRLRSNVPSVRDLSSIRLEPPVILYTDAEGSAGFGAVLVSSSSSFWVGGHIPSSLRGALHHRATQIFPFEVIAIWAALQVFRGHLQGRRLLLFIDNQSALAVTSKGTSTATDVQAIVSCMWDLIDSLNIQAAFRYVPSKLNLSDPPSRGRQPIVGTRVPLTLRWERLHQVLLSAGRR